MKIPFILLCHQRPIQLEEMITSIELLTDPDTYELILVDNASTQPQMGELLKKYEKKYKIIYNSHNIIFNGFNSALQYIGFKDKFILSDPDIVFQEGIPSNWITLLSEFLDHIKTPKVGVALDWTRIPETTPQLCGMKECTMNIQSNPKYVTELFPDPYYIGSIDTTLAMYRRDTYDYWDGVNTPQFVIKHPKGTILQSEYNKKYPMEPVRIGGRFTCIHTGWEMASNPKYDTDYSYYRKSMEEGSSDKFIPSTMRYIEGDKVFKEMNDNFNIKNETWKWRL